MALPGTRPAQRGVPVTSISQINLGLRQNHRRGLQLVTVGEDRGSPSVGPENDRAIVKVPFQRKPVYDAAIKGSHFVGQIVDEIPTKKVGRKDTVLPADLGVLVVAVWLFLPVLVASGVVGRETVANF